MRYMLTMKSVVITAKKSCELQEQPIPKATGEFVTVKIHIAPMCTEVRRFITGEMHHPLGHEAAGEVVETAQAGSVEVDARVVVMPQYPCGKCELCRSGNYIHCRDVVDMSTVLTAASGTDTYAQYMIKQDWLLLAIPDDMSYEHASMACCGLGPSFGGMQQTRVDSFDTVLVTGLGPVGLGAVVNAIFRGARIIGVESNSYRADLALQ